MAIFTPHRRISRQIAAGQTLASTPRRSGHEEPFLNERGSASTITVAVIDQPSLISGLLYWAARRAKRDLLIVGVDHTMNG